MTRSAPASVPIRSSRGGNVCASRAFHACLARLASIADREWGSGATSGGEGAVRAQRIRKVEANLEELDRKRREG